MRCVASCTILLKSNIVYINTKKSGHQKIGYHDNDASATQTKLNQVIIGNGFISFCKTRCGFGKPQTWKFWLLTYTQFLVGSINLKVAQA